MWDWKSLHEIMRPDDFEDRHRHGASQPLAKDCPAGQEVQVAAARDRLKKHADDERPGVNHEFATTSLWFYQIMLSASPGGMLGCNLFLARKMNKLRRQRDARIAEAPGCSHTPAHASLSKALAPGCSSRGGAPRKWVWKEGSPLKRF